MKKILIGLSLIGYLSLTSCYSTPNDGGSIFASKEMHLIKTISFDPSTLKSLTASASSSDFTVYGDGDTKAYVEVYANSNSNGEDAVEQINKVYDIQIKQEGSDAKVIAKGRMTFNGHNGLGLSFKIHVPANTASQLTTSSGDIEVHGLNGLQNYVASSGEINVENIKGDLSVNTSSGDIEIKNVSGSKLDVVASSGEIGLNNATFETLSLNTSSGDITVTGSKGNASVNSNSGEQHIELLEGGLFARSSSGDQQIALKNPSQAIDIVASSGNVHLAIPQQLKANLNVNGGTVSVPKQDSFVGTYNDDKSIEGKINGGGIPLTIRTSSGDINIDWK